MFDEHNPHSEPEKGADDDAHFEPVTLSEFDGVRYVHLGSIWVQGAMRIRKPQKVELEYVQRMLASLLWLDTDSLADGTAVQLGLGAGAITRFTTTQLRWPTTVVEINPWVIEANKRWFHLQSGDERLSVVAMDAGLWLRAHAAPQNIRLLHVDLYDRDAGGPVLDDEAFYADCRAALAPGGVMSVNLFGRHTSFERSAERVAKVFGAHQVWSIQPTREGNTALIATRDVTVPTREVLSARAAFVEKRYAPAGLPATKWLRMVRPYVAPAVTSAVATSKPSRQAGATA